MRTLSDRELVALWERAAREHPLVRALHMLDASRDGGRARVARDGSETGELADLDMGERNRRLMALFVASFGPRLEFGSSCPECEERVEVDMDLRHILTDEVGDDRIFRAATGGLTVRFRLPSTRDLLAVTGCDDARAARATLLARCIVDCRRDGDGEAAATTDLPRAVLEHVAGQMGQCDPHAEILARMTCPECGTDWRTMLDIGELVWARMAARARTALQAVHVLARAYAWSESDILAMSDTRRALYLSMVDA